MRTFVGVASLVARCPNPAPFPQGVGVAAARPMKAGPAPSWEGGGKGRASSSSSPGCPWLGRAGSPQAGWGLRGSAAFRARGAAAAAAPAAASSWRAACRAGAGLACCPRRAGPGPLRRSLGRQRCFCCCCSCRLHTGTGTPSLSFAPETSGRPGQWERSPRRLAVPANGSAAERAGIAALAGGPMGARGPRCQGDGGALREREGRDPEGG